jgi:dTDP-4-amino-4,6-dideoxygalactose transaminase
LGTNRKRFLRNEIGKYTWIDNGSSYLPSDLLAAFLWAQFKSIEKIQKARRKIWDAYRRELSGWAQTRGVQLPFVPKDCEHSSHMFYLVLPELKQRQKFLEHLASRGVHATFHYQPLHLSKMGRSFGGKENDCPVTERVSDGIARLPFYTGLSPSDQRVVIEAVKDWRC